MEVEWRRHRADELRELAKQDAIVIVPVGSLEQHGPHLPVEIDTLLGESVALRTARLVAEKEKVLVLPCLWTGISEHHMSFGGTVTLDFRRSSTSSAACASRWSATASAASCCSTAMAATTTRCASPPTS